MGSRRPTFRTITPRLRKSWTLKKNCSLLKSRQMLSLSFLGKRLTRSFAQSKTNCKRMQRKTVLWQCTNKIWVKSCRREPIMCLSKSSNNKSNLSPKITKISRQSSMRFWALSVTILNCSKTILTNWRKFGFSYLTFCSSSPIRSIKFSNALTITLTSRKSSNSISFRKLSLKPVNTSILLMRPRA